VTVRTARLVARPLALNRRRLTERALATLPLICVCALLVAHVDATHAATTPPPTTIYCYDRLAANVQVATTTALLAGERAGDAAPRNGDQPIPPAVA